MLLRRIISYFLLPHLPILFYRKFYKMVLYFLDIVICFGLTRCQLEDFRNLENVKEKFFVGMKK